MRAGPRHLRALLLAVGVAGLAAVTAVLAGTGSAARHRTAQSPIQHVVIVLQENHSFDEVLGRLCQSGRHCDGAFFGRASGRIVALHTAPDIVPNVTHNVASQTTAIDGGRMDGFDLINGCTPSTGYACYEQYASSSIPNLTALAQSFALSDRTFEDGTVPSWGAHLDLVATQTEGFTGDNPHSKSTSPKNSGWGCDSLKDADWKTSSGTIVKVPACIPQQDGSGPYRASPAYWIPTIMDRLDAAHLSWQIDAPAYGQGGYVWSVCPSFADCLDTDQRSHMQPSEQVLTDGQQGTLPALSIVIPRPPNSQHNLDSMQQGDNWIGSVLGSIMNGPDWLSTAVFIVYDDCGCMYDHVAPPSGLGIRVPMVIVSPYARAGFTDSNVASFASMLAYLEHTFGIPPLTNVDGMAYDYSNSFNYSQKPLPPIRLAQHPIPAAERAWLKAHPADPNDPT